jgi:pyridinium-3,5-biscarboxylic acid mononucleotide synthase
VNHKDLEKLLRDVAGGHAGVEDALARLRGFPEDDLGFATLDTHRMLRQGHIEIVLGEHKSASQIADIVTALSTHERPILVTRVQPEKAGRVLEIMKAIGAPAVEHHAEARALTRFAGKVESRADGFVAIVTAGTSDLPIAAEAELTARFLGLAVESFQDIGVAGLHRLLKRIPRLREAKVIIVIAGMEGALPSVVGGLVDRPLIAVPTSIGYGAAANGYAALMGMLSSCASGLTVVNIDNGFGAAYAAYRIMKRPE